MNLLGPLAFGYGALTGIRNCLYDRGILGEIKVALPVISVGNLSAGGNGKTPLCIFLAEYLRSIGKRPVVLSRGYGGSTAGPHLVQAQDCASLVGDEPCMMKRFYDLRVVVSRSRVAGAGMIVREQIGDVIILDDGLQHRRLARDLNLISIDVSTRAACDAFMAGRLLPVGRFREAKASALGRADVIVLSARSSAPAAECARVEQSLGSAAQVLKARLEPASITAILDGSHLAKKRVLAFCALANPEGFFCTLSQMGFDLAQSLSLGDHAVPEALMLSNLRRAHPDLPLVCTEKDAVKIPAEAGAGIYVLKTSLIVEPRASLAELIKRAV